VLSFPDLRFIPFTLPKTSCSIAPGGRPSQNETQLPIPVFQVQAASFRECILFHLEKVQCALFRACLAFDWLFTGPRLKLEHFDGAQEHALKAMESFRKVGLPLKGSDGVRSRASRMRKATSATEMFGELF